MEVLKESIEPTIMNARLHWNLPCEYSVIDSIPNSFHSMYVGNTYTAYAFIQKADCQGIVNEECLTSSAIVSGIVGEDTIQLDVNPAINILAAAPFDFNSAYIITQSAVWSKLLGLEETASCSMRKGEPKEETSIPEGGYASAEYIQSIHKQLVEISLLSNIPTPLTYLTNGSENKIVQLLPYEKSICNIKKNVIVHSCHNSRHRRRNHRRHLHRCHFVSSGRASISLTSIARHTLSSFSGHLKSMIGLFLPYQNPVVADDVQMLEDEVEYQEKKGSQLQLDDTHNLVYPSFYFKVPADNMSSHGEKVKEITLLKNEVDSSEKSKSLKPLPWTSDKIVTEHSSDEETEVNISDNESDSSVDPEWDDLKPPSDLLPLIHMQLYSGAWPLVRPFSYAVGIPLDEIRKLPLANKHKLSNNEDGANFWSTALAIVSLEEHFAHLPAEWDIIAFKGRRWLERNQHVCSLTMDEVYHVARKLIMKQIKLD